MSLNKGVIFCTMQLFSVLSLLFLTLYFAVQMATPGKRSCTSGRGAQLKSGTFALGGSTSSPSWA